MTIELLTASDPLTSEGLQATHRRLLAVGATVGIDGVDDPGEQMVALMRHAGRVGDLGTTWLILVALLGAFPDGALVRSTLRRLEVSEPAHVVPWLLRTAQSAAKKSGSTRSDIAIVTDRVLVDVNLSAKWSYTTGMQRVVRETARLWKQDHGVELVAWNRVSGAYRHLTPKELARFAEPDGSQQDAGHLSSGRELEPTVIVPWGAPLILLEVPNRAQSERLAALGEYSPSPIRLVGYDCIPVASADLVPGEEPEKFAKYVDVVKVADRVAAISESAAIEFRGLTSAFPVQGLPAPRVTTCVLPSETKLGSGRLKDPTRPELPVILSIGTLGPRKNQAAVLVASELLWRERLQFELRLLGHGFGAGEVLNALITRLEGAGRPLAIEMNADDDRVAESLAQARCVVFPSLHEGFGLPVIEALSAGVPVITSDHGSLAEVAVAGGVMMIDAEDTSALAAAMRQLLTDDVLHDQLLSQARARPVRTWNDYAKDLWAELVS